jgi:hypothetical protein
MATLQQAAKQPKELKQIAAQIKNVALFKAPYKTGNLRRRLNQANRAEKMLSVDTSKNKAKITVSFNVAPPGAEYGKWFNDPPRVIKRTKLKATAERKGNWNFGKEAFKDASVKKEIKKFLDVFQKDYAKQIKEEIVGVV